MLYMAKLPTLHAHSPVNNFRRKIHSTRNIIELRKEIPSGSQQFQ